MRRLSFRAVCLIAVVAVAIPLGVAIPAQAAPRLEALQLEIPDSVWAPPEAADDAVVPDDLNVPDEPWAPQEATRLDPAPDANQRGIAPLGAPVGTVAGAPGTGELPWFSFQDFTLSGDSTARVNLANGNLLVKANDLSVAVPGYALRHDRFYNGLSTQPGSLGGGWHSNNGEWDIGLMNNGSTADYYGPNGLKLRFTRVGSTANFTGPAGSNMSLRQDSSSGDFNFILTHNQSGDQMIFAVQGWLTATLDRNGIGEYYSYNMGSMVHAYHTNGRGIILDRDWGPNGTPPLDGVSDTAGRKVQYTYEGEHGPLKTVTSTDGKVTTYNYDSTGRLASIVVPSAAAATTTVTFSYDSAHRVTKVAQQPGIETLFSYTAGQTVVTDSNGRKATYGLDQQGRVVSTKDALNRSRSQTWTANSDIATTTDALSLGNTTYTYDGSGNRTSAELPTGAASAAVYAVGAGCSAPNTGTAFQPKCSTDDAGNKKQFQYDAAGNLTKQTDTTGTTAVVEFERTYGTCGGFAGQVCSTKDGRGNITKYTYDGEGNMTKVTPPSPLGSTSYTYDSLGRVTSVVDGKGDKTAFQYDVRDRVVVTTFANAQRMVSSYHSNGLEQSRADSAGGKTTFTYDHQGRLKTQSGPRAGVTQSYTYDEVGNMLTATDGSGTTTYSYDVANQLVRLSEPGGTCPSTGAPAANSGCVLFAYDSNGQESKRTMPGGATTATTRDASGRPTRITAKAGDGSTAVDIGYSYTGVAGDQANVRSRTSFKEQGVSAGAITTYSYDSRNRLTLAEEKTGSTTSASWAYSYDGASNRTRQVRAGSTGTPAGTINYAYNAANQLTSATGQTTTWTYDAAGNQTRNGLTGISSSFGDRLQATQNGSTSNTYFGTGNTDRLAAGSVTFDSSALGLTTRKNGTTTHSYTRTPLGAPVGLRATSRHYYVHDHLGSVVGIFGATGTYSGGYSYSPFGETRSAATNGAVTANNLRYIGGHHESGSVYKLGARYYDASIGRFTQLDPSGQETHPYAYGESNPIRYSDPSGTDALDALGRLLDVIDIIDLVEAISDGDSAAIAAWSVEQVIAAVTEVVCIGISASNPIALALSPAYCLIAAEAVSYLIIGWQF